MATIKKMTGLLIALSLLSMSAQALQPPTKEQLEKYKSQGILKEKISKAKAYGNHKPKAGLSQLAHQKVSKAAGYSNYAGPQITPWDNGFASHGTQKTFTLLLAFEDAPAPEHQSKEVIYNHIHGDGDPARYPNESLTNFYKRSSYGQLTITGDVLDWYTTPYPRDEVVSERDVIKEALQYHANQGVDFSQYDNDGDGDIDYFSVIWTGEVGEWASTWWGHQTSLYDPDFKLSGKTFGTYSWQWLSWDNANDDFDPQVLIHETGHALGLPDYYDYDVDVGPPVEIPVNDMMRNNLGDHNSFSKFLLGWITPKVVGSGSETISLAPSSTSEDALIIMPELTLDKGLSEYFVVQHRDRELNDTHMSSAGLLIWHVDATLKYGNFEFNNSYSDHHLIRLLSANENHYYLSEHELTTLTTPSSQSYRDRNQAVEITDITRTDDTYTLQASIVNIPQVSLEGIEYLQSINQLDSISVSVNSAETVTKVVLSLNDTVLAEDSQAPYEFDISTTSIEPGNVTIKAEAFTAIAKGSSSVTALKLPDEPSLVVVNLAYMPQLENTLHNFIKPITSFDDIPLVSPADAPAMFIVDHDYEILSDEQASRIQDYINAGGHLYYENLEWYWDRDLVNQKVSFLGVEATGQWSQSITAISGAEGSIVEGLTFQPPEEYYLFAEVKGLDGEANAMPLWIGDDGNFSNTAANQIGTAKIIATSGAFSWLPSDLTMTVMAKYLDYFGLDSSTKPMSISVGAPEITTIEEANTEVDFTISRLFDDGTDSKVNIAITSENAIAGVDYQAPTIDTISFASGELTKTVTVSLLDDFIVDGNKVLSLTISGDNLDESTQSSADITITDNEHRGLVQFKLSNVTVAENAETITISVERIDGIDDELSFAINTTDVSAKAGQDYTAINEQVTLTQGQVEFTVTFDIIDNNVHNANKTFTLSLTGEHIADNDMMTVTIINDDAAPVTETSSSSGGGSSALITLLLIIASRLRTKPY